MPDIAELGFKTKTDELEKAETKLDQLSAAAANTNKASDKLGKGFDGLGKRARIADKAMGSMAGTARKLATIIGGVLTAAIAGLGLQKFIDGTMEAERVQAQLGAALRSTGGAAGQTVSELNAHAAALQKITNYGDETTNAAQGVLLTFTRIKDDVFPQATEAVLNVATAMKMDLQSAAIQVGKALNDPATGMTALSRAGITFSEAQKKVVKELVESGKMAEAQAIILKELETQFGGSAEAARGTLGGALTSLGNAWGDLFEISKGASEGLRLAIEDLITAIQNPAFVTFIQTIGAALFGAFSLALQGATLLANGIGVLVDNIDTIGVAAGTAGALMLVAFGPAIMGAMISGFVALGTAGVTAIRAIGAAILANPLGAIAVGITVAVTAIYHFRDEIQKAIGIDVVQIAKGAANTVIGSFVAAYEDIKFVWQNFPAIIGAAVIGAVNATISGINAMVDSAKVAINTVIELANNIPGVDLGTFETGGSTIKPIANEYADQLASAVQQRNSAVEAAMSRDYIGELGQAFTGSTPAAIEFTSAINGAGDAIVKLGDAAVGGGSDSKGGGTKEKVKELADEAKKAAEELADFSKGVVKGIFSDFTSALEDGKITIQEWADIFLNAINKIADRLINQALDAIFQVNGAMGGLGGGGGGGIFGNILGWLFSAKGNVFDRGGHVQAYANGGVVNRPTLMQSASGPGVMGEAGPEAIMPLTRTRDGKLGIQAASQSQSSNNAPVRANLNVTVNGARGNAEIQEMVSKGVGDALTAFNDDVMPGRVNDIVADNPRWR